MKGLSGLRVVVALFVAAIMPLELAHCAFMPLQASAVAMRSGHECCAKSAPTTKPTDAAGCACIQLPLATSPASVLVSGPTSVSTLLGLPPKIAAVVDAQLAHLWLEPDARSGSPPDPSTSSQSPRSPPHSA